MITIVTSIAVVVAVVVVVAIVIDEMMAPASERPMAFLATAAAAVFTGECRGGQ